MSKYSLQKSPGPLIRRIHQIGMSLFADEFRDEDITPLQFSCLWVLRQQSNIDQITLAQAVALDRTTCSQIIIKLEEKGLIIRETDPDNRRAKLVSISEAGIKVVEELEAPMDRVQKKLIQPLSVEERKVFLNCLRKLADSNNEFSRAPMRYLPLK